MEPDSFEFIGTVMETLTLDVLGPIWQDAIKSATGFRCECRRSELSRPVWVVTWTTEPCRSSWVFCRAECEYVVS